MDFSNDAINAMIWLAPGYLAFRIYRIDADWNSISQLDVLYSSLIFSVLGYATLWPFRHYFGDQAGTRLVVFAFVTTMLIALAWRKWGHTKFHWMLNRLGLTNEDNTGDVWQRLFNNTDAYVTQINVYLKNGDVIACDDTRAFDTPELRKKGLYPYYTHKNGQLSFVPNRRCINGNWSDLSEVNAAGEWGLRMVYINPDELQRLEVRIAPL
tara:strand:+ start:1506 stop:2138 length:633 start_codon:yes stop_codon:yes gene_type:complete